MRVLEKRPVLKIVATLVAALSGYVGWLWLQTPDVSGLRAGPAPVSSVMRIDAERIGIDPEPPAFASLAEMTPLLACAVVKAEDVRFFSHGGFDWPQLWLALRDFGRHGGASTITQQLARNLFLNQERTLHRKLREAFTARRLERTLDKARILELYLNIVPLGPRVWGVREASRHYFDKAPAALDLYEVVFLTSLIAAPNAQLSGANLERVTATQHRVLTSLHMSGLADFDAFRQAYARHLDVAAALGDELPLAEALSRVAPEAPSDLPRRSHEAPLPLEDALGTGCGYDREVEEAFKSG